MGAEVERQLHAVIIDWHGASRQPNRRDGQAAHPPMFLLRRVFFAHRADDFGEVVQCITCGFPVCECKGWKGVGHGGLRRLFVAA